MDHPTRQAMITSPLHVERTQVRSQLLHKLKQPVPQSLHHHVILSVQLGRTAEQTPQQRVNTSWRKKKKNEFTASERVRRKDLSVLHPAHPQR